MLTRDQLFTRDGHMCVACGRQTQLTIQHRLNRKQGGRHGDAADSIDLPSNWVTLCLFCNNALEADAHFAETGRRMGWKLREHEQATTTGYFHTGFREWRFPDDQGGYAIGVSRNQQTSPRWG